jgi:N-acetylglutamate synthase-like GNAT family acetyltransferase
MTAPSPFQFRVATASDAEAITSLINIAFRGAEQFFIDGDRIDLTGVQKLMETGEFLLAEESGQLVGCVSLEPRNEGTYLGLLSVDPRIQKSGIGSRLVTFAEQRCREQQRKFIDIYIVNLRLDLPDFYRKRGWVETGTLPFPPELQTKLPCHFITMTKTLGPQA